MEISHGEFTLSLSPPGRRGGARDRAGGTGGRGRDTGVLAGARSSARHQAGDSYENTRRLDGTHWCHVKFVEPFTPDRQNGRWLLMSDVCKHCVRAGCEVWQLDRCLAGGDTHSMGSLRAMAREILDEHRLTARLPAFDAWLAAGAPSEDRLA